MDLTIYDLIENDVDKFIDQDGDRYARIIRPVTKYEKTVDIQITTRTVAVDTNFIIIEYPNGCVKAVNIPSCDYLKIEVM